MALDVEDHLDWTEIESLMETSYRHFALKRMLNALAKSIVGWQAGKLSGQLALDGPPLYLGLKLLHNDFGFL